MIEIENLSFGYQRKSLLFDNLNLNLEMGHIYGLLGKNGAGKSTLLKNIAGLVHPLSGTCRVNGFNAAKRLPSFLQELFFIPEEIELPPLTANVFVRRTGHFYPKFDLKGFNKLLTEFDVSPDVNLAKLSFGQQKKVMISFGLATKTALLIMDEPTNGLDIPSKVQFRRIMAAALTDDRCMIISTHQIRDLDSLIDTLLILHNKEIVLNQSLDRISERLFFSSEGKANKDAILYKSPNAIGNNTISINHQDQYNKVDMELLFSAIIDGGNNVIESLK
jgi:ABC-2 type transport system ATP-binding protein